MGSPQLGQGKDVLLATVNGTPEAEQVDARFCIIVPQRAGDRLLLNMVDRRSPKRYQASRMVNLPVRPVDTTF